MRQTSYLESKVLTASPPQLHLMLLEGAIRCGRQAEEALQRGDSAGASAPLLRVLDIVGELLAGVRETNSELNTKLADLYWFLFRRATQAKLNADALALREMLRLLEFERQTWQMVCEKFGGGSSDPPSSPAFGHEAGQRAARGAGLSFNA